MEKSDLMSLTVERMTNTATLKEEQLCSDPALLCEVQVFLENYQMAVRMLRLCREDQRARQSHANVCGIDPVYYGKVGGDADHWLEQLQEVRSFVESLPNRPVKMLLYYHYIRNLTVERTAEELDISRRAAFRLKKKALAFAAARLIEWRKQATQGQNN